MAATKIYSVIGSGSFDDSDESVPIVLGSFAYSEQAYHAALAMSAHQDRHPGRTYGVYHLEITLPQQENYERT